MGSDQQTPQTPPPEAEAAYASFLTLRKKDANADFDAFCAERPGVAGWLRLMRASWEKRENSPKGSGAAVSLHEFIKDRFGDEANPAISLDPKPPSSATSRGRISQRLEQLAARVPKTSRYTLQGEVARGGMGVILKVWDEDLRRTLAMKSVLGKVKGKPGEATPLVDLDNLGRFLEEAQITGQLDHPGIVPVHELGVDGEGRVYFTMRLVRGLTLDKVFKLAREEKEGWTRPRALDILMRICEAMAYAHSKGVIHRDIKPSNIMVGKFGETYVMDWGLAKVIGRKDTHNLQLKDEAALLRTLIRTDRVEDAALTPESPLMTMDGTIVGTPAFMSPEQAGGDIEILDERTDVFALGGILCEILTGKPPYPGPKQYAIAQASEARQEDLSRRLASCAVDVELVSLARECMAPDPAARPRNAAGIAKRLGEYMASVEERAQASLVRAAEERSRRRATLVIASSVVLVLMLIGGGWFWLDLQHDRRVRDTASNVRAALAQADAATLASDWDAATAALGRARAFIESGEADEELRAYVQARAEE
ncbi:MAG: serine/threonine-protein kinase, partial [Planctomycetota bacterium]|nr:serine/threonine-protein kinase [Planctomycetota bacterium]